MLATQPGDPFLTYMLAMELEKEGQHDRSLGLLRQLMIASPPHVPSFFMAAQHLAARGEIAAARTSLRDGIEAARQQGDSHAAAEMSEFLQNLGSLGE